jgi:hypothetical protein
MLLPFDLRADRDGWTVFEIATDRPAFLDSLPLAGLSLDEAEDAVNALNKLEIACQRTARKMINPAVPHRNGMPHPSLKHMLTMTVGSP